MAETTTPGDALGAPELSFGEIKDRVELLNLLAGPENEMGLIDPNSWTEWRKNIPPSPLVFTPDQEFPDHGDEHEYALWEFRKVQHLVGRLAPDLLPRLPRISGHADIRRMDDVDIEAAAEACRAVLFSLWPEWTERLGDARYLFFLSKPETWSRHPSDLSICFGISVTTDRLASFAPNLLPLFPFRFPWSLVAKDFEVPATDDSPGNTITRYYDLQGHELTEVPFELAECFYDLTAVEIVRGFRRVLTGLLWPAERHSSCSAAIPEDLETEAVSLQIGASSDDDRSQVEQDRVRFMTPRQVASLFNCEISTANMRLVRWRQKNPGRSAGWIEDRDRGPREAKFLYRVDAIRHLFS